MVIVLRSDVVTAATLCSTVSLRHVYEMLRNWKWNVPALKSALFSKRLKIIIELIHTRAGNLKGTRNISVCKLSPQL